MKKSSEIENKIKSYKLALVEHFYFYHFLVFLTYDMYIQTLQNMTVNILVNELTCIGQISASGSERTHPKPSIPGSIHSVRVFLIL